MKCFICDAEIRNGTRNPANLIDPNAKCSKHRRVHVANPKFNQVVRQIHRAHHRKSRKAIIDLLTRKG